MAISINNCISRKEETEYSMTLVMCPQQNHKFSSPTWCKSFQDRFICMFFTKLAVVISPTHLTSPLFLSVVFSWIQSFFVLLLFSCSLLSDSLRPHGLQHNRLPCPSLSLFLRVQSDSCHGVSDAIQPSHLLLSLSPPGFNLSQNQSLFQ